MLASDFQLHDELLNLQQQGHSLENAENLAAKNPKDLIRRLDALAKTLADAPDRIQESESFDEVCCFLSSFPHLTARVSSHLTDTLIIGLQQHVDLLRDEMASADFVPGSHTEVSERYAFILQWFVNGVVTKSTSNADTARGTKRAKSRSESDTALPDTWGKQSVILWKGINDILRLKLNKLWTSTPARDTFVGVLTKVSYQVLEHQPFARHVDLRLLAYGCIGQCVQHYNHTFAAKTTILQNLQHYDHLSDNMAELLVTCYEQYEAAQLVDEVLRDISNKDFNSVHDKTGPKSFGRFLVRLSELSPKAIMKQMGLLIRFLDSELYTIRSALIEVIGNLIVYLSGLETTNVQRHQVAEYFELLEQRFRDLHFTCRSKVLQVCIKLSECKAKFPKQRPRLIDLVIGRFEDKTSNVRKNAIKALTAFLKSHPFYLDGGLLAEAELTERFEAVSTEMKAIANSQAIEQLLTKQMAAPPDSASDSPNDEAMDVDSTGPSVEPPTTASKPPESPTPAPVPEGTETLDVTNDAPVLDESIVAKFMQLQLQQRYYRDALRFVHQLHDAIPILGQLLASTNKSEVMEAMDFFVAAYHYQIADAAQGIRKMVHLVWTKDNASDEVKGVKTKLIDCYYKIYMMPRSDLSAKGNANHTVRNLISLTYDATLADLTSLEELLGCMRQEDLIAEPVVDKLWSVYAYTKEDLTREQRRGAIMILGMLAKADRKIVTSNIDSLLRVGLGSLGRSDLVLAKYTCLALQCLGSPKTRVKGSVDDNQTRLPRDHPICVQLQSILGDPIQSLDWFPLAEQVVNTLYALSEQPDTICTEIIRRKTHEVMGTPTQSDQAPPSDASGPEAEEPAMGGSQASQELGQWVGSAYSLCQLLFLVGHVAIKQILLLEVIEAELKRRKGSSQHKRTPHKDGKPEDDELEQVAGTTEDDVADTIQLIRERELLYGPRSLLALYGPLLAHVCAHRKLYADSLVQVHAVLALAKMMCVSAEFCEQHLPLLMSILTHTHTPAIRSNIIIALGDVTVCFNNLIGENVGYLYGPLQDPDNSVKKNTLMVLTHLVLNGMIKVKGQLGEMAKCLEDPDQRISDLAKLFFTELASKDNYVYNNLPDMISTLSSGANAVSEAAFGRIMRFLFDFIKDKERQIENIVDKLCQRFRNTDDIRQWRDIAFCLALMPYRSERSFKRLLDGFPHYHDKLTEEPVYKALVDIATKTRAQTFQKQELKHLVDEFDAKVREARSRCTGGQADDMDADRDTEMAMETSDAEPTVTAPDTTDPATDTEASPRLCSKAITPMKKPSKRAPQTPGTVLKTRQLTQQGAATGRRVKFSAKKLRSGAKGGSSDSDSDPGNAWMDEDSDEPMVAATPSKIAQSTTPGSRRSQRLVRRAPFSASRFPGMSDSDEEL
ncbi:condensin complex non-SMC subunit Cnd1 [Dimargaris xerosporica]|nr:condensin complex non-SMC subunit Cnd1 [Dimargaris xerosporica]